MRSCVLQGIYRANGIGFKLGIGNDSPAIIELDYEIIFDVYESTIMHSTGQPV